MYVCIYIYTCSSNSAGLSPVADAVLADREERLAGLWKVQDSGWIQGLGFWAYRDLGIPHVAWYHVVP